MTTGNLFRRLNSSELPNRSEPCLQTAGKRESSKGFTSLIQAESFSGSQIIRKEQLEAATVSDEKSIHETIHELNQKQLSTS